MKISMDLVKELRERTGGLGMMLCKKALEATEGDLEAAQDWLKKQGHAQAAKVVDRETNQGLVAFAKEGNCGSLVILNCETDFVSSTDVFCKFINQAAKAAAKNNINSVEALNECVMQNGSTVAQGLLDLIAAIKENIVLKEVVTIQAEEGEEIFGYVYRTTMNDTPDIGKSGSMMIYTDGNEAAAKDVGMHIVANNTQYLVSEEIPASFIEKEKAIFRERMQAEGRPENMLDKIVEGKVAQMYKEHALLQQPFFKEPKMSIGEYCSKNDMSIVKFVCLKV